MLFPKLLPKGTSTTWYLLYSQRVLVKKYVNTRLLEMAHESHVGFAEYLKCLNEGQFYNFCSILPPNIDDDLKLEFVIDELLRVLSRGEETRDLTVKYFAQKSLVYLRQQELIVLIQKWIAEAADDNLSLEQGATYIAQWFQPMKIVTLSKIQQELDSLANLVKESLNTTSPKHPVLNNGALFTSEDVKELSWTTVECKQVIQAIESVFKPLFNNSFKKYFKPDNSYINLVLERRQGIPITLCLVVMCVARRLGVALEPVNFPQHFILRWKEFPLKQGIEQYRFIDAFNGSYNLNFETLIKGLSMQSAMVGPEHCDSCTNIQVLQRMLRNLISLGKEGQYKQGLNLLHHAVELYNLLIPDDVEKQVLSVKITLHHMINLPSAISKIQEIMAERPDLRDLLIHLQDECEKVLKQISKGHTPKRDPPKRRADNPQVVFSIGMVMKHRLFNYMCVIRGWDSTCKASEHWINQMGVDQCERGRHQPFYNVWVMDGSDRYAAEENLIFARKPRMIKHPEVGSLFESFNGRYYVPGRELQQDYPDDLQTTHEAITQFCEEGGEEDMEDDINVLDDDSGKFPNIISYKF
ncbi:unnamed protein product [Lymnaea stagnalis]|uniref:Hemimethylated DNA-binding domain-containing protein n=1 Tax=Lymnaea stagnalis TaxID=6523 RepID=A0AAV2IGP5_LYMST